ncbi:MAG: nucleoside monophosphate kinase [Candidatus Liptonbacteria bacterium]|nr:nucleoside monophosphate kinase [Candidatus Liptonbacteria bacterium]
MSDAIFFIGPQGSGKGTQARLLAERLGFFYWEMGGISRELTREDSPLGRRAKELNDQGILFPDDMIFEMVRSRLSQIPAGQGIVFDGIPRRLNQAHFLLDLLRSLGRTSFLTIHLPIPQEESLKRLLLRAEIEKRVDDTREKIERRLEQYAEETLPVVEYLRAATKFVEIDGQPPIPEVTKEINAALTV